MLLTRLLNSITRFIVTGSYVKSWKPGATQKSTKYIFGILQEADKVLHVCSTKNVFLSLGTLLNVVIPWPMAVLACL
jgi:hypothetical protein